MSEAERKEGDMSIEALWTVEFVSSEMRGGGIVVLETGRLFGGDGVYYYLGRYDVKNGNTLECDVEVTYYNTTAEKYSVFGELNQFRLKLSGKVNDSVMNLQGCLVEDPRKTIRVHCTRRASLP